MHRVLKMKPSKLLRVSLSSLFSFKGLWLFFLIYSFVTTYCLLIIARKGSWSHRGIFDLISYVDGIHGSTNQLMFIIVAIPFITTLMTQLVGRNEKSLHALKYGSRFRTWHANVIAAISLSFILTCLILAISFLGGALLVGTTNTWLSGDGTISQLLNNKTQFQSIVPHLATYKMVLTIFITKFLGFLLIAFLTLFLKYFIKSGALIMTIFIALAGIDLYGILPVPIFTRTASLALPDWLHPMTILYHCTYLAVASFVLYGVTGLLYERKDFLS